MDCILGEAIGLFFKKKQRSYILCTPAHINITIVVRAMYCHTQTIAYYQYIYM